MKHTPFIWVFFFLSQLAMAQKNKPVGETDAQKSQRFELESLLAEGMKYTAMEEYLRADSVLRSALKINAAIPALNYELARTLLKRERLDEAAIFSQKAAQLAPDNKYYAVQLAEIYTQQRKYSKAAEIYRGIIRQSTDNAEYGLELAAVNILDEKYEEALKSYDEVERALGVDEDLIHQKQRIYLKLDKPKKAIEEAQKLINAEPTEAQYVVELAQLLMMDKRPQDAKEQLEKALKINPDEANARMMLADIYRQSGDSKAAEQQIGQMFNNPNSDIDTKMQALVGLLREAKDDATRQEVLNRAAEIVKAHPKDMRAYVVYADLLVKADRKAEARDAYVKASRINSSMYEVWGAILQLDGDLNQIDSLLAHSEQALETFPNQGLFWYSNGSAYLVKRNYQKAVEALEEAQKLTSDNKELQGVIYAQLGDAYNGLGQHEKSDASYEEALKIEPKNDHVQNNYSYFLSLRKAKLERAKEMAAQVVSRNPDNATYLDTYAWVLYVMKDYKGARTHLEKAIALGKGVSGTIVEHYGDVLYQLGERDKAVEQWKKAKTMGENTSHIDKKIATGQLIE
ncbi:tetratricopeptide repeat protein [Runella slithyformis]|uniref:Tetratricopeptide TPR_2 repeat-containing protein n=1 Tax=Runella slithyformis (strain ATCC 29530 / DSM 19594 / LMG 11500 / NCIMB 11436 / LSU 4) TaxID=761193 RepID=A0A7U3ZHE2_RUNSL|nr:tetratricopeptide repeat protein [Runella slithyformis]AEI47252.1 Tetratricopeptide TPR_2 repeat-containing protein [Runella slithyformis DSM 19594]